MYLCSIFSRENAVVYYDKQFDRHIVVTSRDELTYALLENLRFFLAGLFNE